MEALNPPTVPNPPATITTNPRNPADNLTLESRRKGGQRSAAKAQRDKRGQFTKKPN